MNCPETQELLEWLLLGELEEARVRQADEHLARCPDCRAEKERLHLLLCEMQVTADAGGVPAGLVEKVCAAGKAEIYAAARRTALWRAAAGAAAVAAGVLVVLGVAAWPPGPSRNQRTASVVAPKPAGSVVERWRYPGGPVKADPSSEGIVARGGSVYMLDGEAADARVVAVDAATGRPRWRSKARSAGYLEAGETRVYCLGGSADEAPELICLDAADGQEVWRYGYRDGQPAQAPCRPVAVRDRWVCWSVGREVLLLDARTGGLVWRRRPDGHGLPSRAVAVGDRLCVATGAGVWSMGVSGGQVACLVRFERRGSRVGRPVLALAGSRAYFLGTAGQEASQLYCMDLADRRLLWQRQAPGTTAMTASGSSVYLRAPRVTALDGHTGRTLWTFQADGGGPISVHKGLVCFVDSRGGGRLMALEPGMGRPVWQMDGVRWYYGISPETHTAYVEGPDGAVRAIGTEAMEAGRRG